MNVSISPCALRAGLGSIRSAFCRAVIMRSVYVIIAVLAVFSTVSCGPRVPRSGVSRGGNKKTTDMFTFGLATEIDDYNPFTNLTADGRSILFNVYEGLVRVASNEEVSAGSSRFLPCIAEKWEYSKDAKEWTFYIKNDVHFHDGSVVTAKEVESSLIMAREAGFAGCGNIKAVSYAQADGGESVTVKLKSADTSFMAAMTSPIVKVIGSGEGGTKAPIATGPYKIESYKAGDAVTLSRFDDYHGEKASLKRVKIKFIGTQAALPLQLLSGAIDGFTGTGDLCREVADDKVNKYRSLSNAVQMLALNNDAPQFRDVKVRRAIRELIDADDLIKKAAGGYGKRSAGPVIPALIETDSKMLKEVAYNKEEALSALKDAGEESMSFTITVPSNYTVHVKTAEVIIDALLQAGIKCDIKQVDWATWLSEVYMGRNYEATIISVDAPLSTSASFLSRYASSAGDNFINFRSIDYDKAYSALLNATSDDDKAFYTQKAVQCLIHEAASVWIEDIEQDTVYNKRFTGYRSYPLFALDLSAITLAEN